MYQASVSANALKQDRELKSKKKPSACPWCGSHRIAIVLGGMPVYIPEMESELDKGEASIVDQPSDKHDPTWQCTECGAQFFRELCLVDDQG